MLSSKCYYTFCQANHYSFLKMKSIWILSLPMNQNFSNLDIDLKQFI